MKLTQAELHKANQEYLERYKEAAKESQRRKAHEYYLKNKDKFKAANKKWRDNNRARYNQLQKESRDRLRKKRES